MELHARQTVFAEGCRGSLTKALFERFKLREGADPQTYGIGIKELWEVSPDVHRPGLTLHTVGWPLDRAMAVARGLTGGAFALLTVLLLAMIWRGRINAWIAAPLVVLAYLLVGAQWFNPWYLLWLVPLAIVPLDRRLLVVAVAFSLLAPLTYLLQYDSRLVVPVVFVPIAVLAVLQVARTRSDRRSAPVAPPTFVAPGVAPHG